MSVQYQEKELTEVLTNIQDEVGKGLMVYNDEFNTFDHVIGTLVKICKHDQEQAEQCTYIIHFNGKCQVKNGTYDDLKPMKDGMVDAGIKAAIV